jgi:serine/threonine-protein kinase RsbT
MDDHESSVSSSRQIAVKSEEGIVLARQAGRAMSASLGLSVTDQTLVATAISEVARNIILYAGRGVVELEVTTGPNGYGLRIRAVDEGPGIPDIELAMRDGYSTGRSLGLGLPGARRLMDDFSITSEPGHGTIVTMVKWGGTAAPVVEGASP